MPIEGSFSFQGHKLAYDVHGEGERTLVLVHGLLMNRRMYDKLAPEMASRGNRVVTLDLLGHGRSDRPVDMRLYNLNAFAEQVLALVDHLELDPPVLGGTSLGANVAIEFAVHHPDRVRGLFIEMPVLDNALLGAAMTFTPILIGLRFGQSLLKGVAALTSQIPRSHYLVDIGLDWVRQDPAASRAVLEGILFGGSAPASESRRRIEQPALVIGHHADPLHPFSDAGMLAEEMPHARRIDANSILEWRLAPGRLDDELAGFLNEVYELPAGAGEAEDGATAAA
jgi:pimeloyl-ACP methyl ester carboxylesterase